MMFMFLISPLLVILVLAIIVNNIEKWYYTGNSKKNVIRKLDDEFSVIVTMNEYIHTTTGKRKWVKGRTQTINTKLHHVN